MKAYSLLMSAIIGLMLISAVVAADKNEPLPIVHVEIENPDSDDTTGASVMLRVTSEGSASCKYRLDDGAYIDMIFESGNKFIAALSNLADGSHTVEALCVKQNKQPGIAIVTWTVDDEVSVPEYPSAIIPALLSIASFGLVSFKIR